MLLRFKYSILLLVLTLICADVSAQNDTAFYKILKEVQHNELMMALNSATPDDLNAILLQASQVGDTDAVLMCIKKGADVNTRSDVGVTPLMYASENGFLEVAEILVFNGANVNARPDDGRTALIAAASFNHDDVMDYLIHQGALLDSRSSDSTTALFFAAAYGNYIPVDMLLFYGANTHLAANDGTTPLMIAAYSGNKDIVELLLKKDSLPDVADNKGWTALICAAYKNDTAIVRLLVEKGANVNLKNLDNYTPLALAAFNGNADMTAYLLKHGADATIKTDDGATPYRLALYYNHRPVLKTLKKFHVKKEPLPVFNSIEVAPLEMVLNNHDFMFGMRAGISDIKYHLGFNVGYDTRLWADRMLVANGDNSWYQFWERRSMFYVNAEKLFRFGIPTEDFQHGIFIAGKELFTYGKYHATNMKPDSKFLFAPGIGYQVIWYSLGAKATMEYLDLKVKNMPPLRFSLTFYMHWDRKVYWTSDKNVFKLLEE